MFEGDRTWAGRLKGRENTKLKCYGGDKSATTEGKNVENKVTQKT